MTGSLSLEGARSTCSPADQGGLADRAEALAFVGRQTAFGGHGDQPAVRLQSLRPLNESTDSAQRARANAAAPEVAHEYPYRPRWQAVRRTACFAQILSAICP